MIGKVWWVSPWQHAICEECWEKKNPNRTPVRLKLREIERCCFCQKATDSGIYVRENPADTPCGGEHDD